MKIVCSVAKQGKTTRAMASSSAAEAPEEIPALGSNAIPNLPPLHPSPFGDRLKILGCYFNAFVLSILLFSFCDIHHESGGFAAYYAIQWASLAVLIMGAAWFLLKIYMICAKIRRHGLGVVYGTVSTSAQDAEQEALAPLTSQPSPSGSSSSPPPPDQEVGGQMPVSPVVLSLETRHVYHFVYGWGLSLFTSLYCLSGISSIALCYWFFSMFVLCAEDLAPRNWGSASWAQKFPIWMFGVSYLVGIGAMGMQISDSERVNFSELLLSSLVPSLTPYYLICLRMNYGKLPAGMSIWKIINFSMPLMVIVSLTMIFFYKPLDFDPSEYIQIIPQQGMVNNETLTARDRPRRDILYFNSTNFTETMEAPPFEVQLTTPTSSISPSVSSSPAEDGFTAKKYTVNLTFVEHYVSPNYYRNQTGYWFVVVSASPLLAVYTMYSMVSAFYDRTIPEFVLGFATNAITRQTAFRNDYSHDESGALHGMSATTICFFYCALVLSFLIRKII